jgi:hypothetical protein
MEFILTSQNFRRRTSYNENRLLNIVCTNKYGNDTPTANNFTYRTEVYLQQREKQNVNKSPPATITTWKNLKYQKRILDNDQAEIDRVLSTIDSIHGTFNRSLLIPYNQVYSSLYGDDDKSIHLMKTFCQRQNHYMSCDLLIKDNDDSNTQEISSSFGNFQDTDFDDDTEDEEEKENENEKKYSYDSGYGSVMPMKQLSRESLRKITRPLNIN